MPRVKKATEETGIDKRITHLFGEHLGNPYLPIRSRLMRDAVGKVAGTNGLILGTLLALDGRYRTLGEVARELGVTKQHVGRVYRSYKGKLGALLNASTAPVIGSFPSTAAEMRYSRIRELAEKLQIPLSQFGDDSLRRAAGTIDMPSPEKFDKLASELLRHGVIDLVRPFHLTRWKKDLNSLLVDLIHLRAGMTKAEKQKYSDAFSARRFMRVAAKFSKAGLTRHLRKEHFGLNPYAFARLIEEKKMQAI